MESSANILHKQHQLQDQHVVIANSSGLVIPSCYAAGSTHGWTPSSTTILNTGSFNACSNVGTLNSRDSWQQNNNMVLSSMDSSSMGRDLGFHWANITAANHITAQPVGYDLHLARLKNESSDSSSTKVNEVLSSPSQSIEDIHTASYMKINERRDLKDHLNAKLKLRNFPSVYQQMNGFQLSSEDSNSSLSSSGSVTMPTRSGNFSQQIFPTLNDLNSFSQMSLANYTTLDMNNLQSLDLFNTARFNEGLSQLSRDHQHGDYKVGFSSYGQLDHHMQQPSIRPLNSPNHMSSSFSNGVAEAKRPSIMLEPKAPQPASKKSRMESRTSCPPFNVMKVRKEKLGDRIAALQQLVAPFGKTDTASVLMEAIGYIRFLQNQIETLSVPYMRSSRSKTRLMQAGSAGYESEESRRDLRSRGLCLVPVSCLSYVTDGGGGVWPPPPNSFGGGI